jgi:hypothetical protein
MDQKVLKVLLRPLDQQQYYLIQMDHLVLKGLKGLMVLLHHLDLMVLKGLLHLLKMLRFPPKQIRSKRILFQYLNQTNLVLELEMLVEL